MALIEVNYLSGALYRTVPVNVILPLDDYDTNKREYTVKEGYRFKTLYLLHGLGRYGPELARALIS
ncbi:MAG: hypothetical protein K6F28_06575 [Lachnospiraceae bacterium]|nr:hypothetical protein [Lachnospiraceae bacterium]